MRKKRLLSEQFPKGLYDRLQFFHCACNIVDLGYIQLIRQFFHRFYDAFIGAQKGCDFFQRGRDLLSGTYRRTQIYVAGDPDEEH